MYTHTHTHSAPDQWECVAWKHITFCVSEPVWERGAEQELMFYEGVRVASVFQKSYMNRGSAENEEDNRPHSWRGADVNRERSTAASCVNKYRNDVFFWIRWLLIMARVGCGCPERLTFVFVFKNLSNSSACIITIYPQWNFPASHCPLSAASLKDIQPPALLLPPSNHPLSEFMFPVICDLWSVIYFGPRVDIKKWHSNLIPSGLTPAQMANKSYFPIPAFL